MIQTSKTAFAVLLVTCLLMCSPVVAQIKTMYHFGFIGSTGDTSVKLSEPVIIDYSKCFDITNGLPRFLHPKAGAFAISCNEAPPKVTLQVHAYPNPVVNYLTIRSLISYPEKGSARYRVVLTDMMGNPIREIKTDMPRINEGFSIPMQGLRVGYYIVTLFADKEIIQSFKILKAA